MEDNKQKVLFGRGTLGNILSQIDSDKFKDGLIAFGHSDDENYAGGAIFANGQLVSSRVLDVKYDDENNKLIFWVIDSETKLIKTVEIPISSSVNSDGGLTNEQLTEKIKETITAELAKVSEENSISKAVEDKVREVINATDIILDSDTIYVNISPDDGTDLQTYTLNLKYDPEQFEISTDGKLHIKDDLLGGETILGKDIFVESGEIITNEEDGKKYIQLILNDESKSPILIPVNELVKVYKGSDSIDIDEESLTISVNSDILEKIDKVYDELYGNETDGVIMPGMVDSYRTLVGNVTDLHSQLLWQDLNLDNAE